MAVAGFEPAKPMAAVLQTACVVRLHILPMLVWVAGIEPATCWSQASRATTALHPDDRGRRVPADSPDLRRCMPSCRPDRAGMALG